MDEIELARQDGHESVPVPERMSLPSFCCVRVCDNRAAVMRYEDDGETLLVYAFCPAHADTEVP